MDIMLKRVLSLIGSKRGAKKELAEYIGISPNVITAWISGTNESYKKHASKIAEYYGVSMDWLSGKTDIKKDAANINVDGTKLERFRPLIEELELLDPEALEDVYFLLQRRAERARNQ